MARSRKHTLNNKSRSSFASGLNVAAFSAFLIFEMGISNVNAPVQTSDAAPTLIFPQFAEGMFNGSPNCTRIILTNGAGTASSGRIIFRDSSGNPSELPLDGDITATLPYSLEPWGVLDIETDEPVPS